jgi:hypothetical protein
MNSTATHRRNTAGMLGSCSKNPGIRYCDSLAMTSQYAHSYAIRRVNGDHGPLSPWWCGAAQHLMLTRHTHQPHVIHVAYPAS